MTSAPIRRSPVHSGEVVGVVDVTARMRRVTVRADALRDLAIRPAQDVEMHLREATGRRVKRRYTIRHSRPRVGEIDLDVFRHGDGPGSAWGSAARPGDAVEFQGPRGKLELRPASCHLLIGDESALPAVAVLSESLPPGEAALALVEVTDADDEQPVAALTRWVHRGAAAPGTPAQLLPALADVPVTPDLRAYLLGETRTMVALRAELERRGVAHDAIFVKGYWNLPRR